MLIECPSCHTRARLSDDKAGSKVRCPQCERVWVAGMGGGGGRRGAAARSGNNADEITRKVVLGVGGLLLVALFFYWRNWDLNRFKRLCINTCLIDCLISKFFYKIYKYFTFENIQSIFW